jgi:hypothetical protein
LQTERGKILCAFKKKALMLKSLKASLSSIAIERLEK